MRNSYFPQSRGGHFALFNFLWRLGPWIFWHTADSYSAAYLKIVYANFSAKMPTGLRNFVFPDLSTKNIHAVQWPARDENRVPVQQNVVAHALGCVRDCIYIYLYKNALRLASMTALPGTKGYLLASISSLPSTKSVPLRWEHMRCDRNYGQAIDKFIVWSVVE